MASVTVTAYGPAVLVTVVLLLAVPPLHIYDVPPPVVKVTLASAQIVPSLLVVPDISVNVIAAGVGKALTVTVAAIVAIHSLAFLTVTV